MADLEITEVRSNIGALSAERLHQALVEMVRSTVVEAARFLRAEVPKDTGRLAEAVDHSQVEDLAKTIEARLGIKPVGESFVPGAGGQAISPRSAYQPSDSSHYPVFVDRGTGVFGPTASPIFARVGHAMVFEIDGHTVFARQVQGQHGQHFMAATLAYVHALVRADKHIRLALEEMAAKAAAELPAVLA